MTAVVPTMTLERQLARGGAAGDAAGMNGVRGANAGTGGIPADLIVGFDEVGRGALAGPVMVGAAAVWSRDVLDETRPLETPPGVADSKMLTERRREAIYDELQDWCAAWAIGEVSNRQIDEWGISHALGIAALRALDQVERALGLDARVAAGRQQSADRQADSWQADGRPSNGQTVRGQQGGGHPVRVAGILDGPNDYITTALDTFDAPDVPVPATITTIVKGDQQCATVATAAVLAKVTRDRLMSAIAQDHPEWSAYGWDHNKGYGSPAHKAAIAAYGPTPLHRISWKLV